MKFSTKTSLLVIYLINFAFSGATVLYALGDFDLALPLYIALMIVFLFIVLKTNILFERKGDKHVKKS